MHGRQQRDRPRGGARSLRAPARASCSPCRDTDKGERRRRGRSPATVEVAARSTSPTSPRCAPSPRRSTGAVDVLVNNAGRDGAAARGRPPTASSCSSARTTSGTSRSPACCSTAVGRPRRDGHQRARTGSARSTSTTSSASVATGAGGAYGQSKLANLLFTFELQRRLERRRLGRARRAAHPGYAATNLQSPHRQSSRTPSELSQSAGLAACVCACRRVSPRGRAFRRSAPSAPATCRRRERPSPVRRRPASRSAAPACARASGSPASYGLERGSTGLARVLDGAAGGGDGSSAAGSVRGRPVYRAGRGGALPERPARRELDPAGTGARRPWRPRRGRASIAAAPISARHLQPLGALDGPEVHRVGRSTAGGRRARSSGLAAVDAGRAPVAGCCVRAARSRCVAASMTASPAGRSPASRRSGRAPRAPARRAAVLWRGRPRDASSPGVAGHVHELDSDGLVGSVASPAARRRLAAVRRGRARSPRAANVAPTRLRGVPTSRACGRGVA